MQTDKNVFQIYPIYQHQEFQDHQIQELIDLFLKISSKSKKKVNELNARIEYFKARPHIVENLQDELNQVIQKWSDKVRRLGGVPIELFKVQIPTEDGYYLWEFPRSSAEFYPGMVH